MPCNFQPLKEMCRRVLNARLPCKYGVTTRVTSHIEM